MNLEVADQERKLSFPQRQQVVHQVLFSCQGIPVEESSGLEANSVCRKNREPKS